jgi:ketosteroid isomerase-like protein
VAALLAMDEASRREIVEDALRQLETHLRRRDVGGTVALFHQDGVAFGSEEHEHAVGADELRAFLSRLFARPHTYGWSGWEPLLTGGSDVLIWFVAPATVVVRIDQGGDERAPYRLSGVLERADDGRWLFRLFNGSEPSASD